jgi:hypothetical protein
MSSNFDDITVTGYSGPPAEVCDKDEARGRLCSIKTSAAMLGFV